MLSMRDCCKVNASDCPLTHSHLPKLSDFFQHQRCNNKHSALPLPAAPPDKNSELPEVLNSNMANRGRKNTMSYACYANANERNFNRSVKLLYVQQLHGHG
ncbi:hypothetical protein CHARACLAT_029943 [Characodon lateralis]|uniref:Uncharacterized protein n=1 Tax=Characodon lateralis TaxID=208331 RepID=A0ABU7E7Q6_9TELE|nr:hypothetical protein [Characodon lateralis]